MGRVFKWNWLVLCILYVTDSRSKNVFCSTGPLLPFPSLFLNRKSYSRDGHLYCPHCHRARLPDGQDQGEVLKNCKLANSLSSGEYQDQAKKVKDIWILRHLKKILKREKQIAGFLAKEGQATCCCHGEGFSKIIALPSLDFFKLRVI